ncbi:MAG: hypothetical protein ACPGVG_19305, partial [Mycobacterium sp.]
MSDWNDVGVFPLQDHQDGVPTGMRRQLVGGRVAQILDPSETEKPEDCLIQIGRDRNLGTIGDIHPWIFWQTVDRGRRATGSWAMAWAGVTMGGGTGGAKGGRTGTPVKASSVQPVFDGSMNRDGRLVVKSPGWPKCFPSLPKGTAVMVMPGTDETTQQEVMLHADPRMVAANVSGPGEAGSLVCDLQPDAEMCMDKSATPGVGGRHARLQSMMRVIALPKGGIEKLGTGPGNSIAWNLTLSGVDGLAGYGMVYAPVEGGGGSKKQGPITPRPPVKGPITGPRNPAKRLQGFGESATEGVGSGVCAYGKFSAQPKKSHGIALMGSLGAFGPLHAGHEDDQHKIGEDRDGHPINSGHISTGAYFYRGKKEDGPFFFEGDYPNPPPMPLKSRVHLSWDKGLNHPWIDGQREGMWRWWCEVPFCCP